MSFVPPFPLFRMYKDYSQAYLDIMDDDPDTKSYEDFLPHGMSAEGMEDTYKKRKDSYAEIGI